MKHILHLTIVIGFASIMTLDFFNCADGRQVTQNGIERVRFTNGDVTLEGELNWPAGNDKVPLVVFVHGSGRATREDYAVVSRQLNEAGFATFRYDKRGVGGSGGTFIEVSTSNSLERINLLAADAAAAVLVLSNKKRIDRQRIIVMGGSQAGWIIPVISAIAKVSHAICISGPTVSVGEEIYYSQLAENNEHTQAEADEILKSFNGPYGFDNISYIALMNKPSLWIYGGRDVSIPVKKCIARLDSLKNASNHYIDIKIYPEGDHGIFNLKTNQMENYFPFILDWLNRH